MVGVAAPVMKKYIKHLTSWVVKNKIKSMLDKPVCIDSVPDFYVGQDPLQGDLRRGTVTEHELTFHRRESKVIFLEEELADMLGTD